MTSFELFLVLAGLLVGSAIDASADRFAHEESWVTGRSRCRACDRPLAWYELIPLISWVAARGRCRTCKSPIGWSVPVTELAGAGVAVAAVFWAPPDTLTLTALLGWLLLALATIDLRTYLLPDALNAAVLALGAVMVALTRPAAWPIHVAGAVIGYGLLWIVEFAYRRLRGRDGLGRGDAKLLGALGIWVGATGIAPVLLLASLTGILAALSASVRRSAPLSATSAIAFGPWIALGGFAVWLAQSAGAPF
ncbi:MAG: prepilin peptidase [Hyphomonas sp.]|uniref:prepilin peptidase n=1 Tax=Hyphomonas sp. TaxID=87 RepID=UPI0017E928C8|nr:A24 family peptidase [Hyphomonas sp.]MBU3920353.1 A24 family peptidase [Alphaproteobacteria bacterium]MBA3067965.1 prepilin peptidase [Hyphomonas sp.]MBU4061303.1 A24 family peptidase [Alphaproteobacteria bacterium]MBU4162556.1 A24 family peptidase [Alphaproteobacteria bacterium]MBU4568670.1 A24 family peptidase [Alphaproteobacteria bacterium]